MFTGLVQATGRITGLEARASATRLLIDPGAWGHRPTPGDSICINGCCLTVAGTAPASWAFDVIPETLAKTTLGSLAVGSMVNLEHAATPSTLLGGHVVQGHVDGVGRVSRIATQGEWRVRITPPAELMEYITPKGSVCIDGVSLTIAAVQPREWFEVALIPVTLEKTTLGSLKEGSPVNLEADAFAKTIIHWLKHYNPQSPHLATWPLGHLAT